MDNPPNPGSTLRLNLYLGGHLSVVSPVRVIEHGADGLLSWLSTGSPVWEAALPPGTHLRDIPPETRPPAGFPLRASHWRTGNALIHQPEGAPYSVWWLFSPEHRFTGWYVNFEHRVRRGDDIDVVDLELDMRVAPDRSWRWKDEESFAAKTGHPAYWTAEEAAVIRAAGRAVARLVEKGAFPFDGTWCDFLPSPGWEPHGRPVKPASPLLTPSASSGCTP